ncbi:MAG: hypothetical protein FH748_03145 [Balneolaceae bacterium]|nr:hypothetical protein [Balneolaceae bacterium]
MVKVYKTDVVESSQAAQVKDELLREFPGSTISFDLEDCDNVLRIEGNAINGDKVRSLVSSQGFSCKVLP